MSVPLLPKATAVWLVDNTSLTFQQIADFCVLHPLEVKGIADGEVAVGIRGIDPTKNGQLSPEEVKRCEQSPDAKLVMQKNDLPKALPRGKGPRYTPLAKRHDKPDAIYWIIKHHPYMRDSQIIKLIGTTKNTIAALRDKSHWNMANIEPRDPVLLGLCRQGALDAAIAKAQTEQEAAQKTEEIPGKTIADIVE